MGGWRWVVVVLVGVSAAACVATSERRCDDGTLCDDRLVCRPEGGGCVEPALVEACAAQAAGAVCDLLDGSPGRCRAQVCELIRCGDGEVDTVDGEVCDDGNAVDGDGCARDCTSDETCGNGVRDPMEACDDGNLEDDDACTAACALPTCGDGTVQAGEACDLGAGNDDAGACTSRCAAARCGDFLVQVGVEACDLGSNNSDTGSCTTACVVATCGDGLVQAGVEACDDGNLAGDDACQPTCQAPRCGDGFLDAGEACDDGNDQPDDGCAFDCASDETCGNGVVDYLQGEACDDGNLVGDDACQPTCQAPRCGDGFLDAGEACDDGDNDPRTACAFDCSSDQTCGNGLVDVFADETCDDGGTTPYDGCSSRCVTEALPVWSTHGQVPSPRLRSAMAYDPFRHVTTLFGGDANGALGDTWTWDGKAWLQRHPVHAPGRRFGHAMAYDSARDRVILVGGVGVAGTSDEVWEWDGVDWALVATMPGGPVDAHALAYDPVRAMTWVLGGTGQVASTVHGWDGHDWTSVAAEGGPGATALTYAAAAFDAARGFVVVTGGLVGGVPSSLAWKWSGQDWTALPALPQNLFGHVLVFDAQSGVVRTFGGTTDGAETATSYAYADAWSQEATGLGARRLATGVYDTWRGEAIYVGGTSNAAGLFAETVRRDDGGYAVVPAPLNPGPRNFAAITYDAQRGEIVMFGGINQYGFTTNEQYVWDGSRWQAFTGPRPSARYEAAMAYDPLRARVVLFGGHVGATVLGDTWEWDGVQWSQLAVAGPSARWGASMSYDRAAARITLYSGNAGGPVPGDTWRFDGTAWTQLNLSGGPPSYGGAMWDAPLLGGVRLFQAGAVWAHDATHWYSVQSNPPIPTGATRMAYDVVTDRVVSFGDADTWEFAEPTWTYQAVRNPPGSRSAHALAYDARSRRIVVQGGSRNGGVVFAETLSYRWEGEREEACSSGVDLDGDGAIGCADDDCAPVCEPARPPGLPPQLEGGRCGDATCGPIEDCGSCPGDCGTCAPVCGDARCDVGEPGLCPGDC